MTQVNVPSDCLLVKNIAVFLQWGLTQCWYDADEALQLLKRGPGRNVKICHVGWAHTRSEATHETTSRVGKTPLNQRRQSFDEVRVVVDMHLLCFG